MNPRDPAQAGARRGKGRLAHPLLSLMIAAVWLLLHGSLAPATLIWAAIMGLLLPWLLHDFIGPGIRLRAWGAAVRLAFTVLLDIVVANLAVARIVLHPGVQPQPAWVRVPYTLSDPRAVVLLATIITTTPGTVSCLIDEDRREILVHALSAENPDAVAADILQRYEKPLREIFG
jgi:multicomponent K+:H+ antiporter subunit E